MRRSLRLAAILLVLMLAFSMVTISAFADAAAVEADRDGVLQVCVALNDLDKGYQNELIIGGSCFLINESTVVTCYHVAHLDAVTAQECMDIYGYSSLTELERHLSIYVYYQADLYKTAVEVTGSSTIDFSILQLDSPIYNHTTLTLRDDTVGNLESVYALGFPGGASLAEDITSYSLTASDVTATTGQVSKNNATSDGVTAIQHTAVISSGSSGGPLVDANGLVVGVNYFSDIGENYYYAVLIDQVMTALDTNGIQYNHETGSNADSTGSAQTPAPAETIEDVVAPTEAPEVTADTSELARLIARAEGLNASDYTSDSYAAVSSALSAARSALNSNDQTAVDNAAAALDGAINGLTEASSGPDMVLVIIIIAAIVLVIIVIVVVVILTSRKKSAPAPASAPAPVPQYGGFAPSPVVIPPETGSHGDSAATDVLTKPSDGGETTVLDGGATTVLTLKPYATLTRSSSGEKVDVKGDSFIIGRDRTKASYYIPNNAAISRAHAKITNVNNKISLVDLGSNNGTFVNGVKVAKNESIEIKSGDKIMLADEEFTFDLL